MSTMLKEMYDALKEAGASEEKASAAAVAVSAYHFDKANLATRDDVRRIEERLTRVEERLINLEGKIDLFEGRLTRVEERLTRVEERLIGLEGKIDLAAAAFAAKADLTRVEERLIGLEGKATAFATKADLEKMARLTIMWNIGTIIAMAGVVFAILRFTS